jgi:hypothetical protein
LLEMSAEATDAAGVELAFEDRAAVDGAADATAVRARGGTVEEVGRNPAE